MAPMELWNKPYHNVDHHKIFMFRGKIYGDSTKNAVSVLIPARKALGLAFVWHDMRKPVNLIARGV